MPSAAALRVQIEAALAERIPSALTPRPRIIRQVTPTGVRNIDEFLHGGFPSGAITEIVGPECSGRTSLAHSFMAAMTRADNVCAWVDVSDTLHPESAAAGIDLRRLLWVRCGVPLTTDARASTRNTFTVPEKYFIPKPINRVLLFQFLQIPTYRMMDLGCFRQLLAWNATLLRRIRLHKTAIDRQLFPSHQPHFHALLYDPFE